MTAVRSVTGLGDDREMERAARWSVIAVQGGRVDATRDVQVRPAIAVAVGNGDATAGEVGEGTVIGQGDAGVAVSSMNRGASEAVPGNWLPLSPQIALPAATMTAIARERSHEERRAACHPAVDRRPSSRLALNGPLPRSFAGRAGRAQRASRSRRG